MWLEKPVTVLPEQIRPRMEDASLTLYLQMFRGSPWNQETAQCWHSSVIYLLLKYKVQASLVTQ